VSDAFEPLLATLEADWLEPESTTEEEVEALLGRRAEILARLQSLDASTLSSDTRARYQTRMEAIHTRDQALVAQLQLRMAAISQHLGNAAQGRAAVRGYRAPDDDEARILIRPV
jgi:uncharacterized protein (DUF885 family)